MDTMAAASFTSARSAWFMSQDCSTTKMYRNAKLFRFLWIGLCWFVWLYCKNYSSNDSRRAHQVDDRCNQFDGGVATIYIISTNVCCFSAHDHNKPWGNGSFRCLLAEQWFNKRQSNRSEAIVFCVRCFLELSKQSGCSRDGLKWLRIWNSRLVTFALNNVEFLSWSSCSYDDEQWTA